MDLNVTLGDLFMAGTFAGSFVAALLSKRNATRLKDAEAASAVREQKQDAANSAAVTAATEAAATAKATHTLVNSKMTEQLGITAAALRKVALLTNEAQDVAAAGEAEIVHRAALAAQDQTQVEAQGRPPQYRRGQP